MKKLISTFAVCFAMAASFASCGSKDSSSSESKKEGIVGKWNITDESLSEMIGNHEELKATSGTMEFKDNNKMILKGKIDYSELTSLKDDKFFLQGHELEIVDFTGTELSVGKGEKVLLTFTREEKSDDMYGTYDFPMDEDDNEESDDKSEINMDTCTITFEKDGKSFMNVSGSTDYIYDEEKKELKSSEDDDKPSKVEIDGDKMTITDSEGKVETLTRAD